jgi:hypothetical protein
LSLPSTWTMDSTEDDSTALRARISELELCELFVVFILWLVLSVGSIVPDQFQHSPKPVQPSRATRRASTSCRQCTKRCRTSTPRRPRRLRVWRRT